MAGFNPIAGGWFCPIGDIQVPRVSDTPAGSGGFGSKVLPKRKRMSLETQKLFARLYLEGLSTGDFEPVFRQLLGETAPLSPSTMIRIGRRFPDLRALPGADQGDL